MLFRNSGIVGGKGVDLTRTINPEQVNIVTVPCGNFHQMIVTFQGEIIVRGEKTFEERVTEGLRVAMGSMLGPF
jgi:hypothetical protein